MQKLFQVKKNLIVVILTLISESEQTKIRTKITQERNE